MIKDKKLIIIGDSAFAEVAYEYFMHDSNYEVVAFAVERQYLKKSELFGLPVIAFEDLGQYYSPAAHSFYAAIIYTQLNRLRTRLFNAAKQIGYTPASYISSRAFIWRNVQLGEHVFVFEGNVIQPFVKIEDNVVLWSGNHIGHHSNVRSNCFISSHVVVSGFCDIGQNCFLGVNSTIGNNVKIEQDCFLGANAVIVKDVVGDTLVKGNTSDMSSPISARRFCKVRNEA